MAKAILHTFFISLLFFSSTWVHAGDAFSACRFHFGTDESKAKSNPALMQQVDYLTGGWIGTSETFNLQDYYNLAKTNGKVPVNHTYIIAFAARRDQNIQDCNVSQTSNLCQKGAQYIRNNRQKILNIYASFAKGVNSIMGSSPSVWLMEADFTQYTLSSQENGGFTYEEAGQLMTDMINTVKANAPSALFSIDISPWQDTTWQKNWYSKMPMNQFSYIHTSGGSSRGDTEFISDSWSTALPTWKWTYKTYGKPIFADAGYGVGGAGTGHDNRWDDITNLSNRIKDGVLGVAQVNPASDWATTISNNRNKLPQPSYCAGGVIVDPPVCTPSAIIPYIQVNGGTWNGTSTASVNEGQSLKIGPQPNTGGSWSWSGPNGFTANTRELSFTSMQQSNAGTYTATHTNASGCKSTQQIFITVVGKPASILPSNKSTHSILKLSAASPIKVDLFDLNGTLVKSNIQYLQQGEYPLDLFIPASTSGLQILSIKVGNKLIYRATIIK